MGDDIFGERAVETGNVLQEFFRGCVDLDADGVYGADDGVIERILEGALIDIVLVLADSDGFRVDFHQFGEGIHEAATDADGTADGEVEVREFLAGDFRGGVNRGAGFVDDDDLDGGREI